MKHNNGYLARQTAYMEIEKQNTMLVTQQQMMDATLIAAADVFGMGKGRAVRFYDAIKANLKEICEMTNGDVEGLWETKTKLDRRLKAIVGEENFQPWEERYDFRIKEINKK